MSWPRGLPTTAGDDEPAPPAGTPVAAPSFAAFYAEHLRPVVALAYALSGSRLAAEDLAQEAFMAAYRRWDEVSGYDSPVAWVRRVVANQSVSLVRRRVSEARALTRLRGLRTPLPELTADSRHVWQAVRGLPRRQAQSVALYYLADRSLEEVADVLECSVETVRTHLRRARRTLATRLVLEEGNGDGR